jgi:hypothetical protein
MKSRIRAALLRFSLLARYPLDYRRAPRSKIFQDAWLLAALARQSQST